VVHIRPQPDECLRSGQVSESRHVRTRRDGFHDRCRVRAGHADTFRPRSLVSSGRNPGGRRYCPRAGAAARPATAPGPRRGGCPGRSRPRPAAGRDAVHDGQGPGPGGGGQGTVELGDPGPQGARRRVQLLLGHDALGAVHRHRLQPLPQPQHIRHPTPGPASTTSARSPIRQGRQGFGDCFWSATGPQKVRRTSADDQRGSTLANGKGPGQRRFTTHRRSSRMSSARVYTAGVVGSIPAGPTVVWVALD